MKIILKVVLSFALFGFSNLYAQAPFEGNITMTGNADGKTADAVAHVKANHIQVDGGETIMGQTKIYIDTRLQKITMSVGSYGVVRNYDNDTMNVDLKPADNHKTIAGYDAQEYLLTTKKGKKTRYWVAPGLSKDLGFDIVQLLFNAAPPAARRGANLLLARGLTVLRTEMEFSVMGRDIAGTAEYVKAEPQKLDDAIFKVPGDLSMIPMTEGMEPQDE
jgi:hypothetical protein